MPDDITEVIRSLLEDHAFLLLGYELEFVTRCSQNSGSLDPDDEAQLRELYEEIT